MHYLLQELNNDIEYNIILDLLKRDLFHSYTIVKNRSIPDTDSSVIPIGNLDFVGRCLKKFYSIDRMNAIEVPEVLRRDEFLGREYYIINREELPDTGHWFVKYASQLKYLSYEGTNGVPKEDREVFKDGLYVLSSVISIKSEYRVFVHNDNIIAINRYDGDPCILPDISVIRKMVNMYMLDDSRPKAYTLDIAVDALGRTLILEVHAFSSCGLYSTVWSNELLSMYADGYLWFIKENKELKRTEEYNESSNRRFQPHGTHIHEQSSTV